MAASIRSLVNGINPIIGLSRADLRPGDVVTVDAADLSNTTYAWNIAYKPEGSAAAFVGDPTTSGPLQFTVDKEGPYLIRLITDLGLQTESQQFVRLRFLTLLGDLALVAGGEQNNSPVPVPVDTSAQGWADDQNRNILTLLSLLQSVASSGRILYVDANALGGTGIVDPITGQVEGYGDHSTVQAAIDQAAAVATSLLPWVIAVRPGTYQEDLILKPWVHVVGWPGDTSGSPNINGVFIRSSTTGHMAVTTSPGDEIVLSNVTLENLVSGPVAALEKVGAGNIVAYRCSFSQQASAVNQAPAFRLTVGTATLDHCTMLMTAAASADRAAYDQPGTGTVATLRACRVVGPSGMRLNETLVAGSGITCQVRDSRVVSTGGAGAAAIFTDADDLLLEYCRIESAVAAPIVGHPSAAAFAGPVGITLRWCFVGGIIRFDTTGPLAASTLALGSTEYSTLDFPGGTPSTFTATTKSTTLFYDNTATAPDISSSDVQGAIDDLYAYAALVRTLDDAYDGGIPNTGTGRTIVADQGAVDIVDAPAPSDPPPPGNTDGMLRVVGGVQVGSLGVPEIDLDPNPYGSGPAITMGHSVVANNAPVLAGDAFVQGNSTGDPLYRNYNLRVGTKSSLGGGAIGSLVLRGGDGLANGFQTPDAGHVYIQSGSGFAVAAGDAGDVWVAPGDSAFGPAGSTYLARPQDATSATITAAGAFVGGVAGNITFATNTGAITIAVAAPDNLAAVIAKFDATGEVTAADAGGGVLELTTQAKGPTAQVFFLNADAGVDAALGVFDGQVMVAGTFPSFIQLRVSAANEITIGGNGATGPMIYNADTGKLTVPGLIDPTGLIFDEAPEPPIGVAKGGLFVSDGSGGLSQGDLYYTNPNGAILSNISGGVVSASIAIEEEGGLVEPNATTLNFIGGQITAAAAGGGQVNVTVSAGSVAVEEDGGVVETDTQTLNFTGDGVTATSAGGNQVDVAVPSLALEFGGGSVETVTQTINFIGAGVSAVSAGSNQVNVTIPGGGGGGLTGVTSDTFVASAFAFGGGLSTITVSATPDATASLAGLRFMFRNGVADMTEVAGVPSTASEWRLNGTTLEIGADITATTQTYRVHYPNT
jgi:hypothetical protein